MDKNNIAIYEALCEAQMPKTQARLIASQLPDWTQFATKQDMERLEQRLERDMERLEHRLKQKISEHHVSLIRWQWGQLAVLIGILVAFRALGTG